MTLELIDSGYGSGTPSAGERSAVRRACERLARARIFGKSPVGVSLRATAWIWSHIPTSITELRPVIACGRLMHELVLLHADRRQYFDTYFLRNRAQLRLICRLAGEGEGPTVRIAVLGCSLGAEVYSIAWALRAARPDLRPAIYGVDISPEILNVARAGTYSQGARQLTNERLWERMTDDEMLAMFERSPDGLSVKRSLKEGIAWSVGDAGDPAIVSALGPQDLVVANDFLCHMRPGEAERCIRNIARLVAPGGYLVVSGVDLDVRARVGRDLGWRPVWELIEEIHDGDRSLRASWPWAYWGLEPFDPTRPDWALRYASVFQLGATR